MINISINNSSDSNNYPWLDLDAGQKTIHIKLHLRKICVLSAENIFRGRKIDAVKNISSSSGDNCSFLLWGSCKRKNLPVGQKYLVLRSQARCDSVRTVSKAGGENGHFLATPQLGMSWIYFLGQNLLMMVFSVCFWWACGRRDRESAKILPWNAPSERPGGWRQLAWRERPFPAQPHLPWVQPWSLCKPVSPKASSSKPCQGTLTNDFPPPNLSLESVYFLSNPRDLLIFPITVNCCSWVLCICY